VSRQEELSGPLDGYAYGGAYRLSKANVLQAGFYIVRGRPSG
jgi:hypothetical protein